MKVLLIHAEKIWYKTHRKALKRPPDPPGEYEAEEAVVAYVTVEAGDDEEVMERAAEDIIDYTVNTVKANTIVLYPYAHLSNRLEKPPKAHYILTQLEARIREKYSGDLHRAPFGWYKEFLLHAKGHPLAELSRTYTPGARRIDYNTGDSRLTLNDAVSKGLVPPCLSGKQAPPRGLAWEKAELLGLTDWSTWMARELASKMIRGLIAPEGLVGKIVMDPSYARLHGASGEDLLQAYSDALATDYSVYGGIGPWSLVRGRGDPGKALMKLSSTLAGSVDFLEACGEPPCVDAGFEGRILYYRSGGACLLLGAVRGDDYVLGPVSNLAYALIGAEAERAEREDWVPRLPVWLHPVTVYIVPAGAPGEYVEGVARQLAMAGANVVVDESVKRTGTRIRNAGRLWVPYTVVVGEREASTGTVTVRRRHEPGGQEVLYVHQLVEELRGLLLVGGGLGLIARL